MRTIQLFKPVYDTEACLEQIRQCLDQGWTGAGFKTIEFEEKFKEYTNLPNAHFLNSATSGLHLALEIIKIKHGLQNVHLWNVITPPLTFISDSHVIKHAGFSPLFCDIDESLCMAPKALEWILSQPNRAAVVIYVGMGGNTGELKWVMDICRRMNIPLILDASHMMGTYYDGKHVGREADYTIFSFQSVKNIPTADSGMIVCKEDSDDKLARSLAWLGINKNTWQRQTKGGNWEYYVDFIGYKYHGNSIMAAIALAQLKHLKAANAIRREQAARYTSLIKDKYIPIQMAYGCMSSRHLYQVRVRANVREKVIMEARSKGVQLGVHYKIHSAYPMYASCKYYCPIAELSHKQLISLPIGPHLTEEDVNYVIEVLNGIDI